MFNLKILIFTTLINNLIYNYFESKKKNVCLSLKYTSLVHSIISSLGGILFKLNLISFHTEEYIVYYSLGYIILDLKLYTFEKELRNEIYITYFHHLLFYIGIKYYNTEPEYYASLIITEISTIPLNLMWLSKYHNNYKLAKIYSVVFYLSFFLFRIVNCSYVMADIYKNNDIKKIYLISTFTSLNYYWFFLMTKKLILKLKVKL